MELLERLKPNTYCVKPALFRLAFVFFDPTANKATLAHPPHHGQVIWVGGSPLGSFGPFSTSQFSPQASTNDIERPRCLWTWHRAAIAAFLGSPTVTACIAAHQFSPFTRSRFVAVVRTQSHFIVAVSSRWTQRSSWLFFPANSNRSVAHIPMSTPSSTRLAMLGHGATPPASSPFRQETVIRSYPGRAAFRPFWKFHDPSFSPASSSRFLLLASLASFVFSVR